MFFDIHGFTAWCSEREPSQVFILLESIYHAFDEVGKRIGVFKVETIGDCYVAVCGLPQPREDHASVMVQFARACLKRMRTLTRRLEVQLGPDTGDLRARVGLHSGPVTAGVLRGEKARFQLFGDTMNTASRMESTGEQGRIQISKSTMQLLAEAGKDHWVVPREDMIHVKGKGDFETFWIHYNIREETSTLDQSDAVDINDNLPELARKLEAKARLVDWNVEVLTTLLQKVMQDRIARVGARPDLSSEKHLRELYHLEKKHMASNRLSGMVIDQLKPILTLPQFDPQTAESDEMVTLDDKVRLQMHELVTRIADGVSPNTVLVCFTKHNTYIDSHTSFAFIPSVLLYSILTTSRFTTLVTLVT